MKNIHYLFFSILLLAVLSHLNIKSAVAQNSHRVVSFTGDYFRQKPPGKTAIIFAPDIICFENRSEFAETFSHDGNEFFYTMWDTPNRLDERIWYIKKENNIWSEPCLAPFTYNCFEYRAFFSNDGTKVYYLSKRPLPNKKELSRYANLWFAEKTESKWGEAKLIHLGDNIFPRYFTISSIGTIYFNMEMRSGIYKSILKNGVYLKPEKLPEQINSLQGASHPFIAADESYIIFDADGLSNIAGDYDLYISFKNSKDEWSSPFHLGEHINSPYFEGAASISPDGKFIFFSRFINGKSDIYWADAGFINELKAKILKEK